MPLKCLTNSKCSSRWRSVVLFLKLATLQTYFRNCSNNRGKKVWKYADYSMKSAKFSTWTSITFENRSLLENYQCSKPSYFYFLFLYFLLFFSFKNQLVATALGWKNHFWRQVKRSSNFVSYFAVCCTVIPSLWGKICTNSSLRHF